MISKTSTAVLNVEKSLKTYEGELEYRDKLSEDLVFRRPFKFNYDNSIYHGNWRKDGIREGYGVCVRDDGTKLEGLWKDGNLFMGRIFDYDGCYYEGEISEGDPHGIGKRTDKNGTAVCIGSWSNGLQHLQGERIYKDKYSFKGTFLYGKYEGNGRFTWPDNSIYVGEFNANTLHGHGIFTTIEGDCYEGKWKYNYPNGKGVYYFSGKNSGKKYEGHYLNGQKNGDGIFTVKSNHYYHGNWLNDLPHGLGEYVDKNKGIYQKGMWKYGRLIYVDKEDIKNRNIDTEIGVIYFLRVREFVLMLDNYIILTYQK